MDGLRMAQDRKFYSEREKLLLLSLVESYKGVIECKKTDGTTIKKKQETWEKIMYLYNSNDVTKRSSKQLKKLWENIKQKSRKEDSERKNYMLKTGGGPPLPDEKTDAITERVRSIVPDIALEIENEFDSVAAFKTKNLEEIKTHDAFAVEQSSQDKSEECTYFISDHNYVNEISLEEQEQDNATQKENSSPRKRKLNKKPEKRKNYIEEEAALRIRKLQESIEQQREIHDIKIAAVKMEMKYWQIKNELIEKEREIFYNN